MERGGKKNKTFDDDYRQEDEIARILIQFSEKVRITEIERSRKLNELAKQKALKPQ